MDVIQGGHALKAELAVKIANAERRDQANLSEYDGHEWWQLSNAERAVLDIHPVDWPRMMFTWHCFECFTGIGTPASFRTAH